VCTVTLLAGIAQAAAGFGFGLLAMPLLALFLEPRVAVSLCISVSLLGSYLVVLETRDSLHGPSVGRLLGGSLLGMPLGALLLVDLPAVWLRAAVGSIAMGFCVLLLSGRTAPAVGRRGLWGAGGVAGLLNNACGLPGPVAVLALQGSGLSTQGFRGTLAGFLAAVGTLSLGMFAVTGILDLALLRRYALALPVVWLANRIGRRLAAHVDAERFRRGVLALLFAGALAASASALWEILG